MNSLKVGRLLLGAVYFLVCLSEQSLATTNFGSRDAMNTLRQIRFQPKNIGDLLDTVEVLGGKVAPWADFVKTKGLNRATTVPRFDIHANSLVFENMIEPIKLSATANEYSYRGVRFHFNPEASPEKNYQNLMAAWGQFPEFQKAQKSSMHFWLLPQAHAFFGGGIGEGMVIFMLCSLAAGLMGTLHGLVAVGLGNLDEKGPPKLTCQSDRVFLHKPSGRLTVFKEKNSTIVEIEGPERKTTRFQIDQETVLAKTIEGVGVLKKSEAHVVTDDSKAEILAISELQNKCCANKAAESDCQKIIGSLETLRTRGIALAPRTAPHQSAPSSGTAK